MFVNGNVKISATCVGFEHSVFCGLYNWQLPLSVVPDQWLSCLGMGVLCMH